MFDLVDLLVAALFVVGGRLLVRSRLPARDALFALGNVAAAYYFFVAGKHRHYELVFGLVCATYLVLASLHYLALRRLACRAGLWPWVAFGLPIVALVVVRYVPVLSFGGLVSARLRGALERHTDFTLSAAFVGLSYVAFRTSRLVLDVRNGAVPCPTYAEYLGFAFFAPTLPVGPISPYALHRSGFDSATRPALPLGRALLRVLMGVVKYRFFGSLFDQLGYAGLLLDGHPHAWVDVPVAAIAYYLYLYCNFSGFCDIAIGVAGAMGIPVAENFARPFGARNVREFWNRWHITLSLYMRDVLFSPLSRALVRLFGTARSNEAIAVTIFVVFLLVGMWHGVGWHYAVFGCLHGIAMVANHYYTLFLKRRLGKAGFAAYNGSRAIEAVAVSATFVYVTATIFFFANDWQAMQAIARALR
jgi:D-alanyl-lipoteichoic acid acyltransferase DltB (MBOAT superfamily)